MRVMLTRGVVLAMVVVLVTAGTLVASPPFVEDDAELIYSLVGESDGDLFGWVAANISDITGDGVDDILVPAIVDGTGGPAAGRAYVYSGADGSLLSTTEGDDFELLGYSSSTAGDVDADGVPDYIVGAPGSGFAPEPPLGRALVISGADHSVLLEVEPTERNFFGASVSAAGDLNGDGHGDFTVGAMQDDTAAEDGGALFAYSGADGSLLWSVFGEEDFGNLGGGAGLVGDVNGDGVPDLSVAAPGEFESRGLAYVLSGVDGSTIHVLRPRDDAQNFGLFFASGAGDVNGDGVGDVFVGDYNSGRQQRAGSGAAYVFSGATGRKLLVLRAEKPGDGFGPGRGVGDVDGDGHGDLIVASYTSSDGAPFAGKAYVYSGADGSTLRTITATVANDNFGVDALGLGDVDGDGLTDFLITSVGLAFNGTAPGSAHVVAGIPHD